MEGQLAQQGKVLWAELIFSSKDERRSPSHTQDMMQLLFRFWFGLRWFRMLIGLRLAPFCRWQRLRENG